MNSLISTFYKIARNLVKSPTNKIMRKTKGFNFDNKKNSGKFITPRWFKEYWDPDEKTINHLKFQVKLAEQGEKYSLPEDRLRMPSNELHQLMAKEFWEEVPKHFETILDVGCSDGYMVKHFKDSGKNGIGINDLLYPTDKLFIHEYGLKVYEMDMHCMDFKNESFDAVWCRHTLEHSFAPLQVLSEIYRILKKDGYLFIVLPPPPEPAEPYDGHWHQIPDYQLKYLLEKSNFNVLNIWTAWFSYKKENDNLEIRCICKKKTTEYV